MISRIIGSFTGRRLRHHVLFLFTCFWCEQLYVMTRVLSYAPVNASRMVHTFFCSYPAPGDSNARYYHFFMTNFSTIHIGRMVEREMRRQGRTIPWLAAQLYCDRTNIYSIFKRASIDTTQLLRISVALQHDFFQYYADVYRQYVNSCQQSVGL